MIKLLKGETVYYLGLQYIIFKVKDLNRAVIKSKKDGAIQVVKISDLTDKAPESPDEDGGDEFLPIEAYPEHKVKKAEWRLSIIKPFLNELRGNKAALIKVAEAHGIGVSTMYKWIARYDTYGNLSCLVDSELKGGKNLGRMAKKIEDLMSEAIHEEYLESKSFNSTYNVLVEKLKDNDYKEKDYPHKSTLRRRIKVISDYIKVSRRKGPRTAAQMYDPKVGKTPGITHPLSRVEIDHTELDVMLVDEKDRKVLKRPWITVVLDCWSRMVLGFYISFDPPSAFSVGRALGNAMLRKEKFLESIGLSDLQWPCYGKMRTLVCDNGKEFRGTMLKESCAEYNITLKWRPPRKPEKSGMIERYMGTIAEELKDLAGTTKVSKEMRARFKPERTASLTLSAFEKWFTVWLLEVYHKRPHRGIDEMMPIDKWEKGIMGSDEQAGIGMPMVFTDEKKLRIDFLPRYERTIQRTGVHLHKFRYFSDRMIKWTNARDEKARGLKKPGRKFIFRVDPRNIASILFFDPADNKYHPVASTLNIAPGIMSIWDHRRAVAKVREDRKPVNQNSIYAAYKRMRNIEEEEGNETRDAKKRLERESRMAKEEPVAEAAVPAKVIPINSFKVSTNEIKPYEELEYHTNKRSFK